MSWKKCSSERITSLVNYVLALYFISVCLIARIFESVTFSMLAGMSKDRGTSKKATHHAHHHENTERTQLSDAELSKSWPYINRKQLRDLKTAFSLFDLDGAVGHCVPRIIKLGSMR